MTASPLAGQILLLSGAPGVGKTTAAAILARRPGRPGVHLHADLFWGFVGTGRLPPFLPEAHALNATVVEAVAGAAKGFAGGGFLVVVDCALHPWRIGPFRALGVPLHYAVMRAPAALAVERCAARTGDALRDPEVIADLHDQFADLGAMEAHAVDVAALSPAGTVAALEEGLADGRFRLPALGPPQRPSKGFSVATPSR